MEIKKPIMIVCAGRSGSTMYYRLIARHRDVGWLSTYNQAFPTQQWLAVFSRLYRHQALARIRDSYCFPKPFSSYKFWERYLPGITRHDRPLTPDDVPHASVEPLRHDIARILRYQGRKRFLMKVTGWARMAYFNRIFPDVVFLYLKRHPVAVVSSWLKAGWLNVTGDLDRDNWEWGEVPESYRRICRQLGGGPALAAAVKTQLDLDDIRRNLALFPGRCYELNYEDLVTDPRRFLRESLEFCDLQWDDEFERVVESANIRNYSDRWKQQIPPDQAKMVIEFFERANTEHSPSA